MASDCTSQVLHPIGRSGPPYIDRMPRRFEDALNAHLRSWIGEWPPTGDGVHIVGARTRLVPTWDGTVRPLLGVSTQAATVIAVPPDAADAVRVALAAGLDQPGLGDTLGQILGVGPSGFGVGIFRTADRIDADLADVGEWFEEYADRLPEWLRPFNGPRLVAFDDDGLTPIASVGIKVHDAHGQEIAVVTDEAARGRGLARRLVATAARRILAEGAVPTYLHQPSNTASARVAEAVGFHDRGWKVHGLWPRPAPSD